MVEFDIYGFIQYFISTVIPLLIIFRTLAWLVDRFLMRW